jgi:putative membrane protein insertion efficiency factor
MFLALVRLYQLLISPLIPAVCRFEPTCSNYMIEALKSTDFLRWVLGLKRIISCNPWGKTGYDPYPRKMHTREHISKLHMIK